MTTTATQIEPEQFIRATIQALVFGVITGVICTIFADRYHIFVFIVTMAMGGFFTLAWRGLRLVGGAWDIPPLVIMATTSLGIACVFVIDSPHIDKIFLGEFVVLSPAIALLIKYWSGEFNQLSKTIHESVDPIEMLVFIIGVFVIVIRREVERLENRILRSR